MLGRFLRTRCFMLEQALAGATRSNIGDGVHTDDWVPERNEHLTQILRPSSVKALFTSSKSDASSKLQRHAFIVSVTEPLFGTNTSQKLVPAS
jgi:hypothetical protein